MRNIFNVPVYHIYVLCLKHIMWIRNKSYKKPLTYLEKKDYQKIQSLVACFYPFTNAAYRPRQETNSFTCVLMRKIIEAIKYRHIHKPAS